MPIKELPLVICKELAWSSHVGQEEVGVNAVQRHGLVDHVSTVIVCSVDTTNTVILLKI